MMRPVECISTAAQVRQCRRRAFFILLVPPVPAHGGSLTISASAMRCLGDRPDTFERSAGLAEVTARHKQPGMPGFCQE